MCTRLFTVFAVMHGDYMILPITSLAYQTLMASRDALGTKSPSFYENCLTYMYM